LVVRIVVLAAVIGALAVTVPRLAPGLVSAVVGSPADVDAAASPVAAAPPPAAPRLGDRDGGTVRRLGGRRVALAADAQGHYQADALVNGRTIPVVVDTGATTVALNAATARRLGIHLTRRDYSVPLSTANGTVSAAPVTLAEVRIGGVSVRNVAAVVVPGEVLAVNLLGMSFLGRLTRFEVAGGQLVLVE
jgi:aspartyl protease family protein